MFILPFAASNTSLDLLAIEDDSQINLDYFKKKPISQYIIDSGDILSISVSPYYPELLSKVLINGEGIINLPSLGDIFVRGLTLNELNTLLNKALKEFVKYPDVNTKILEYRSIRVYVEGEVAYPGLQQLKGSLLLNKNVSLSQNNIFQVEEFKTDPLTYNQNLSKENNSYYFPTVYDAIRESGGITEYSDLSNIQVIRNDKVSNGGGKITTTLDFNDLLNNVSNKQNIRIYDKDRIIINKLKDPSRKNLLGAVRSNLNPRFLNIFVTGKVNSPGQKRLIRLSTLNDAIDISGGTKALRGPITYLTYNNNGSIDKRYIKYKKNSRRGSQNNPYLKNGDLIFVGSSIFSLSAETISEITRPFQGLYSTYKLIELITD